MKMLLLIEFLKMNLKIKIPGSCGELVQGFYHGEPILVTCPIKKFSTVEISDNFFCAEGLGEKSLQMLNKILDFLHAEQNFGLRLTSQLLHGKGMASSSADLAAVAKAVALFFGRELSAEKISQLAAEIEPTDGIFFDGIVAMNPVTGKLIKKIYLPGKFVIAIFDYGGEIDTVKFNRRSDFQIPELADNLNFDLTEKSAFANQAILYKPHLEEIINFSKNLGAVTVNVAHSGTVIGIFFYVTDKFIDKKISEIAAKFDCIKFLDKVDLIDGGIYGQISTRRTDL